MAKEDKIKQLLTRGVEQAIDQKNLEKKLRGGKKLRVKLGIDPTGTKIHLGRAVIIRKLRDFQSLGHQVVLILGDATAMVGDPSDKLSKRPMLTREEIETNMKSYKKQLGKLIDLNKAEVHYNSSWLKKLNFLDIFELAESFSLQQMSTRRNFKERMEKGEEVSMREALYPLMQGYDSVAVKADVELGGNDQLFNLLAGRTIQRHFKQPEQDLLLMQMIEGTDGRKMSTSWGNVINIVDEPSDMFGKIMSLKDELILKYFILCTDVSESEIKKIENDLKDGKNPRDIKVRLAKEIVSLYHSKKEAEKAEEEFNRVFSKKEKPEDIEVKKVSNTQYKVADLIFELAMAPSKSEARRLIDGGAVRIDDAVIGDREAVVTPTNKMIVQVGKRKFVELRTKG